MTSPESVVQVFCHHSNFLFILSNTLFRFVTTDLATDIVMTVGDVKFYLHKVLLSR
jgi:hypothetical protein